MTIAVLLTCYNRREKTICCLKSFFEATKPNHYEFTVFLVDDNSQDGTSLIVKKLFPEVNILKGDGNLFWAGGMRLAWETAIQTKSFDAYLLINDDVNLDSEFLLRVLRTDEFIQKNTGRKGIYSSSTIDNFEHKITYGGEKIINYYFYVKKIKLLPKDFPHECDLTNANILWVSREVIHQIGIFDKKFTHGIADYDFSLRAKKNGFPVFLTPGVGGKCIDDHGVNWASQKTSLKERIKFLKSPKGLAYREYLYFINKHFPLYLPYAFIMLWLKTFFPILWDQTKK